MENSTETTLPPMPRLVKSKRVFITMNSWADDQFLADAVSKDGKTVTVETVRAVKAAIGESPVSRNMYKSDVSVRPV